MLLFKEPDSYFFTSGGGSHRIIPKIFKNLKRSVLLIIDDLFRVFITCMVLYRLHKLLNSLFTIEPARDGVAVDSRGEGDLFYRPTNTESYSSESLFWS